jgi:hypothetical protein
MNKELSREVRIEILKDELDLFEDELNGVYSNQKELDKLEMEYKKKIIKIEEKLEKLGVKIDE